MANIIAIGGGGAKGETYYSGTLTTIDSSNKINVNMTKSTAADIEQESIDHPNVLFFTEGDPGGGGAKLATTTVTLLANGWSAELEQTVNVQDITSTSAIIVSPQPSYIDDYAYSGVCASAQGTGTITFRCGIEPESNIVVNVAYWETE